jgi:hypothetical protein
MDIVTTQHRVNRFRQNRDMVYQNIPDNVIGNTKITMDQAISHSGNRSPPYFGIIVSKIFRDVFGGFADYFNAADKYAFSGIIPKKCKFIETAISISR